MFTLKGERRRPRDHVHSGNASQRVDDFLRNPVAKVFLVLARTHIDERQYGDRGRQATLGGRRWRVHGRSNRVLHGSQIPQELARRAIASIRVFLEGPVDDDLERSRQSGLQGEQWRLRPVQEMIKDGRSRIALKRGCPGCHFEQHDSQCKEIRARIKGLPEGLFGRHVACCSDSTSAAALFFCRRWALPPGRDRLEELRHTEVENLDALVVGNHHVARLQVPVHDSRRREHTPARQPSERRRRSSSRVEARHRQSGADANCGPERVPS